MIYQILALTLLVISLTVNAVLFWRIKRKPKRPESVELQEFLADLFSGVGMVAVGRIDPNSILLRSPKQK